jgi:hypothetical protein
MKIQSVVLKLFHAHRDGRTDRLSELRGPSPDLRTRLMMVNMRSDVYTAIKISSVVFCLMIPTSLIGGYRFGGMSCPHLQGSLSTPKMEATF